MRIFQIIVLAFLSISQAQADSDLLLEKGVYVIKPNTECGRAIQFSDNGQVLYYRLFDVSSDGCGGASGRTFIYKKTKESEIGRTFYASESGDQSTIEIISATEFLFKNANDSYSDFYALKSKLECSR